MTWYCTVDHAAPWRREALLRGGDGLRSVAGPKGEPCVVDDGVRHRFLGRADYIWRSQLQHDPCAVLNRVCLTQRLRHGNYDDDFAAWRRDLWPR